MNKKFNSNKFVCNFRLNMKETHKTKLVDKPELYKSRKFQVQINTNFQPFLTLFLTLRGVANANLMKNSFQSFFAMVICASIQRLNLFSLRRHT